MKELDEFKLEWNNMESHSINTNELAEMIKENKHPVLKGVRRHLLIEAILFTLFLSVFYSMFDGDRKPLIVNLLLVFSVLLSIVHNLIGYVANKRLITGENLRQSLENRAFAMRKYAYAAVMLRIVSNTCILIFFCSSIQFTPTKYALFFGMVLGIIAQAILASKIWIKRIKKIRMSIAQLSDLEEAY